jgi:hypothetical protein
MYYPLGKSESWVNDNDGRGPQKSIQHSNTHMATTVQQEVKIKLHKIKLIINTDIIM